MQFNKKRAKNYNAQMSRVSNETGVSMLSIYPPSPQSLGEPENRFSHCTIFQQVWEAKYVKY